MSSQFVQYYLPKHVFLCVVDASVVFLDLHNDKYISLEPEKTVTLITLLSISTGQLSASVNSIIRRNTGKLSEECVWDDDVAVKLVEDLTNHNLLTSDPTNGTAKISPNINIPLLDLSGYEFGNRPNINIGHILKFFTACTAASLKLRFTSTEQVVKSVKKRKHQNSLDIELSKTRDLVEIFNMLRPLFFTAKDHCLFDSLALIEFMARYGIYPTWVFGVKMGPFLAHCWVQDDNFIYNEALAQVHYFTPIMAV